MEEKNFKPYVPANKVTPEFTVTSIVMGVILAVVFGAANAYLGLRVGMTVSASIPAAVISMAVIRVIMKKDSILESNMVQTIGSVGESLAAGAIFTLPALFLWAKEGVMDAPSMVEKANTDESENVGIFNRIAQVVFKKPAVSQIHLDEMGNFIWPHINGENSILDIASLIKEEFGEKAEPLYNRVVQYFKTLVSYGFVEYTNK